MMKKTWQKHDLEGSGLQSINLAYLAARKDIKKAYMLAALFPLGMHQFYLGNHKKGWLYVFLTVLLLACATVSTFISAVLGFAEVILMIVDVKRMENVVSAYNKELKMNLALQQQHKTPENYRGRYPEDSESEQTSEQKILSFAEQEALLKELARKKKEKNKSQ